MTPRLCASWLVMPTVISNPGRYKEDIEQGTRSAGRSFCTLIACMPKTDGDNAAVVRYIIEKSVKRALLFIQ